MRRRHKAEALLIDFDGVLRHFDPAIADEIEERHGFAAGTFIQAGMQWPRLLPAMTGKWTNAEWMSSIAEATGATPEAMADWATYRGYIDQEVLKFIREVRAAGIRVGLGTNAMDDLRGHLTYFGLDNEFDAVVSSAEIGWHKPTREFFAAACEALGIPAKMVLFVDDQDRNIRGARVAGLSAIRWSGLDDLRYVRAALMLS